jgi:hypothetical protein
MCKKFIPLLLLLASSLAWGQVNNPSVTLKTFAGVPSGTCTARQLAVNTTTGDLYACNAGTWKLAGGSASAVTGPGSSTAQDVPIFSDGTGKVLADPGSLSLQAGTSTPVATVNGLLNVIGGGIITGHSAGIVAPIVTPTCAGTCASTWGYKVIAFDQLGGHTVASSEGTTAANATVLDGTHFNVITWTGVVGPVLYKIFRSTAVTTPATLGIIGTVNAVSNNQTKTYTFTDNNIAGDGSTAPATDTTGGIEFPDATILRTASVSTSFPLLAPAGTSGAPSYAFSAGGGIYRTSVVLGFVNPDSGGSTAGIGEAADFASPIIDMPSNGILGWTSATNNISPASVDTGFVRTDAGKVALGNGTTGDASGTLNLARVNANTFDTTSGAMTIATGDGFSAITLAPGGNTGLTVTANGASLQTGVKFNNYNNINLVDNGLASEPGHLDLPAQTAAISASTVCTPSATGRFRISVYEKVTTAASVSSVLGGGTGTVLTYTDGTDSVAQTITMGLDNQGGTLSLFNNGNSTTTSLNGSAYIYALIGVPIQLAVGYTSTGTDMAYVARATCEAL